jgi:hypothetical protein
VAFSLQRTGQPDVDRNLDSIQKAQVDADAKHAALAKVVAAPSTTLQTKKISTSYQAQPTDGLVIATLSGNITVQLPSAIACAGQQPIRIKHQNDTTGTPTLTVAAINVGGRQQAITITGRLTTTTIALGVTLALISDGSDWHSV